MFEMSIKKKFKSKDFKSSCDFALFILLRVSTNLTPLDKSELSALCKFFFEKFTASKCFLRRPGIILSAEFLFCFKTSLTTLNLFTNIHLTTLLWLVFLRSILIFSKTARDLSGSVLLLGVYVSSKVTRW